MNQIKWWPLMNDFTPGDWTGGGGLELEKGYWGIFWERNLCLVWQCSYRWSASQPSLITHHEFLEGKMAQVPTISFFISYSRSYCGRLLKHWSNFELPDATIDISVSVKWSPILEMLWLIGWKWHLPNVWYHVPVWKVIIDKLWLV